MQARLKQILHESFLPVILVAMVIFLTLVYAEFSSIYNADAVTTIYIDNTPATTFHDETEPAADTYLLAAQDTGSPQLHEAADFVAAGRWSEAEAIYASLLAAQENSQTHNDLGILYLKKGDPQAALVQFNKAIASPILYVRAYFNRAITYSRLGNGREAIADYAAFLRHMPNHFDAHYNTGRIQMTLGEFDSAVHSLQRAVEISGGERKARASHALGTVYRELHQSVLAKAAFATAIKLRPDYIAPRLELAAMEQVSDEGDARAGEIYDEIFRLKPDYPPALLGIARRHSAAGRITEAEANYRRAIKFNPEYHAAHYNLGLLLLEQGRYADARAEFEWITKRDPENSEAFFNLARTAYGGGDNASALAAYQRAIDLRGGDYPEAYFNQGLVYIALKRHNDAEAAYLKAIKLQEAYPEAWYNLGLVQSRQGKSELSKQSFLSAIRHNPRYAQAWFNIGVIAGRDGDDVGAVEAYRQALAIQPDYAEARLNLAVRYSRLNRPEDAIREYLALLELDQSYATAWFNLGLAYLDVKKPSQAERALQQALDLDAQNIKIMKALASALMAQEKTDAAMAVLRQAIDLDSADPLLRVRLARLLASDGDLPAARSEYEKALKLAPDNKRFTREFNELFGSTIN
ncbi:MAG: tetratricopeptide repeat protein [Pseudomonadota bacterium]